MEFRATVVLGGKTATGIQVPDDVVAYLTGTTWPEGFKPWVRTPDGDILDPDELIGYLPE